MLTKIFKIVIVEISDIVCRLEEPERKGLYLGEF